MNCGQLFSLNIQSVTIKHGPDGVSDSRFELRFNINLTRDSRPHITSHFSGCKEHNPHSVMIFIQALCIFHNVMVMNASEPGIILTVT